MAKTFIWRLFTSTWSEVKSLAYNADLQISSHKKSHYAGGGSFTRLLFLSLRGRRGNSLDLVSELSGTFDSTIFFAWLLLRCIVCTLLISLWTFLKFLFPCLIHEENVNYIIFYNTFECFFLHFLSKNFNYKYFCVCGYIYRMHMHTWILAGGFFYFYNQIYKRGGYVLKIRENYVD